jgi:putative alpha-1,2-mannosidase
VRTLVGDQERHRKALNQIWFRNADIADGGTLELQMVNTPNRLLGVDLAALPPSFAFATMSLN